MGKCSRIRIKIYFSSDDKNTLEGLGLKENYNESYSMYRKFMSFKGFKTSS